MTFARFMASRLSAAANYGGALGAGEPRRVARAQCGGRNRDLDGGRAGVERTLVSRGVA